MFLKAYQHSAFQFITHVRPYRAIKKHFKSVGSDVVMLGFPSERLKEIFPDAEIDYIDGEMHVRVPCPPIDFKAYLAWFDTIAPQPERPRAKTPAAPAPDATDQTEQIALPRGETLTSPVNHYGVLRKIQDFSLENATPLECMLFLRDLKIELKEHGGI